MDDATVVDSDEVMTQRPNQLVISYTPKGSKEWRRIVDSELTPTIDKVFTSLEAGIEFYKIYARACGFSARRYTGTTVRGGDLSKKSVVCNRQGFRDNKKKIPCKIVSDDKNPVIVEKKDPVKKKVKRKVKVTRVGCQARVRFKLTGGIKDPVIVDDFCEIHNHPLTSINDRDLEKVSRSVSLFHKQLIIDNSKLNIGAAKTFQMCKEYASGYQNVGAQLVDFKNFQRDVKCFIGLRDSELFIGRLKKLESTRKGFYFAHEVDESNCLSRVFWADSISIRNYRLFGDAVSFDPTYGTNMYNMIFTPFTGVDHHKKSVLFACSLLAHEDDESFQWVFQHFLNAMGGKQPTVIITDQDPAIKLAVPAIFKESIHRYCMWHIMEKVTVKVGSTLCKDTDFLKRFNAVVWDPDLEPLDFEIKWQEVISDFNLGDHEWLTTMFGLRKQWIPAYHRDLSMGGILRTTQRSESANSFFKRYENHFGTLVEFWMRFSTAMDQQRYSQRCADHDSDHSLPVTVTQLHLEKHAANVYTHAVFYEFQKEVESSISRCGVGGFAKQGNVQIIDVEDSEANKIFTVTFNVATKDADCSCKLFQRKGLICRHIVWVYNGKGIQEIPTKYILDRWTKNTYSNRIYFAESEMAESENSYMCKVWGEFNSTISILKTLPNVHMEELATLLIQFREKLSQGTEPLTKEKELEMLLGCSASSTITILPPVISRNKGSGKRLTSTRTQSIEKASKPKRLCAYCKEKTDHDRRTCPVRIEDEATS